MLILHFPHAMWSLPCKVKTWASKVKNPLNEAVVRIGKAQERLNPFCCLVLAFHYSSDFHGVHLHLSMGDDKSEVFNLGLSKLALVMSEIEFLLSEPLQY